MLRSLFNALLNYGKEIYNRLSSKILYPIVLNINRYDNTRDETFPLPKRKPYKEKEGSFLMKRLGKISLALLAVIVIVACSNKKGSNGEEDSPSQSFPPEDLPEKFLAGEFEAIYHQTSKAFQESVSLKEFKKLGKDFTKGVNNFESVSTMPVQAFTEYQWISDAGDKGIRSYFAEDYTIEGCRYYRFIPMRVMRCIRKIRIRCQWPVSGLPSGVVRMSLSTIIMQWKAKDMPMI